MTKPPAFQFYPQDYLASSRVAEMTLEEEGVYIRLLCYCWSSGSIPADPERCSRLAGKGCSISVATSVQRAFSEHPTDTTKLVHNRLEKERENQRIRREQTSMAGKKSAAARSKKAKSSAKTDDLNARSTNVQQNVNPSSSTSVEGIDVAIAPESEAKSKPIAFQEPTIDQIDAYAQEKGILIDSEVFWNFYDSKGWMVGKTRMKNWKSAVAGWAKRNPVDKRPYEFDDYHFSLPYDEQNRRVAVVAKWEDDRDRRLNRA